jgi:hypothetical protein
MKCPECGYNQRAKLGLTCGECSYEFVFNPKESATKGLTDGKFAACIRSANQNGTAYFTRNQLYSVCCRKLRDSPLKEFGFGIAAFAIAVGLATAEVWDISVFFAVMGSVWIISGVYLAYRKITPANFDMLLGKWRSAGKPVEKLIEESELHQPPPEWSEPDIYDYGVERLLIVERDILVDLLVKNGQHAEQRMLVISETGYPEYLLPVARRLLEEQAEVPIFLLHDASAHGTGMKDRVIDRGILPLDGKNITDLGMYPEDFQKLKRTRRYDPNNTSRSLPVDAMAMPFLASGLGTVMSEGIAFQTMLVQQEPDSGGGGADFG